MTLPLPPFGWFRFRRFLMASLTSRLSHRYGTACLESTRLAGLANEVSPLRILAPAPLALLNLQLPPPAAEREGEAYVELGRGVGAGEVRWRGKVEKEQREVGGLAREIRTVEAGQRDLPQERQPVRGGEILR